MDLEALGTAIPACVWTAVVALVAGLVAGRLSGRPALRAAEAEAEDARRRAGKAAERAEIAEKEVAVERARLGPLVDSNQQILSGLVRAAGDLAQVRDRAAALEVAAQMLERIFEPKQFLVFGAADRDGKEFRLEAVGGPNQGSWAKGALINDTMGHLGLVVRRKAAMDREDFDLEPPIVRQQLDAGDMDGLRVDAAAPVVVGQSVIAILSVGGTVCRTAALRGALEILAAQVASAVRSADSARRAERLKNTDAMTGLGSRSWFLAEGDEALYRCRSEERSAAMVLFGIDDFRAYVERVGHQPGDILIGGVAEVLRGLCSGEHLLARWSGAEFAVLLPGSSVRGAHAFADRVRGAIGSVDWPYGSEQPRGRLTLSAGISFLNANGTTLDALIEGAAENLASARWAGNTTSSAALSPPERIDAVPEAPPAK